jgi:hypothetical protein
MQHHVGSRCGTALGLRVHCTEHGMANAARGYLSFMLPAPRAVNAHTAARGRGCGMVKAVWHVAAGLQGQFVGTGTSGSDSPSTWICAGTSNTATGSGGQIMYDLAAESAFFSLVSACFTSAAATAAECERLMGSACSGGRFNPAVTRAAECGRLTGKLCSMARVRCAGSTTEFLDASGAVIANGDNAAQKICYVAGPRQGECNEPA